MSLKTIQLNKGPRNMTKTVAKNFDLLSGAYGSDTCSPDQRESSFMINRSKYMVINNSSIDFDAAAQDEAKQNSSYQSLYGNQPDQTAKGGRNYRYASSQRQQNELQVIDAYHSLKTNPNLQSDHRAYIPDRVLASTSNVTSKGHSFSLMEAKSSPQVFKQKGTALLKRISTKTLQSNSTPLTRRPTLEEIRQEGFSSKSALKT